MTRTAQLPKSMSQFPVGTIVAVQDPFSGIIHIGTVTRVKVLKNSYPETFVAFPTKYDGERQWAISTLRTPAALAAMIAERNQLFPENTLRTLAVQS